MAFFRLRLCIVFILTFVSAGFAAQAGPSEDIFTISVAAPIAAKDVQVRYFFTGEFGGRGSSTADSAPGNKIVIKTGVEGQSAKTFKLIAYAPGCQFVTLTVDDLGSSNRQGEFECQKLPTIQLHGRIDTTDPGLGDYLRQRDWQIEALYVCGWAMSYFGIANGSVSPLLLGRAPVAADGSFTIELPDFTADPSWPRISKEAELMFFVKDPATDKRAGPLVVPGSHSGTLRVAAGYPDVILEIPVM